jgi:hypothetical protein
VILSIFLISHGGTGCGSAHKPFFASRTSVSNPASTVPPCAYFRYHLTYRSIRLRGAGQAAAVESARTISNRRDERIDCKYRMNRFLSHLHNFTNSLVIERKHDSSRKEISHAPFQVLSRKRGVTMQRYANSSLYSSVAAGVTYINYDEGKGIGPAPSRPSPSSARPSSLRGPSDMRRCRHTVN